MQLKTQVRNVEAIRAFLQTVKHGTVRISLRAVGEWIIGTPQRGLKHYQAYKYVSRERAYGQTFVSDKQRRFVMAKIASGEIDPGVPHRTGNTQRGYRLVETQGGYRQSIQNAEKGAVYTRHDALQARLNALAGWRKTMDIISTNIKGAIRHAQAAVNEFIKREKG